MTQCPSTPFPWHMATLHIPTSLHPSHTSQKLPCCLIQLETEGHDPKTGSWGHRGKLAQLQILMVLYITTVSKMMPVFSLLLFSVSEDIQNTSCKASWSHSITNFLTLLGSNLTNQISSQTYMHEREQSRRVMVKGTRSRFTVPRSSSHACRGEGGWKKLMSCITG